MRYFKKNGSEHNQMTRTEKVADTETDSAFHDMF